MTNPTPGPWEIGEVTVIDRDTKDERPDPRHAYLTADDIAFEIQIESDNAMADARLIAAAPDLKALASRLLIYTAEDDDAVRISIADSDGNIVKIATFGPSTAAAIALLKLEAERRAALSKATGAKS